MAGYFHERRGYFDAPRYASGDSQGGFLVCNLLKNAMQWAKVTNTTKKITCKYFNVTFYKKGTMHIEFTNEELLKKLNICGSQQKKWLPPAYGKKTYAEMDEMERAVVDEFEGEVSYKKH